jgi:hypothetical protein
VSDGLVSNTARSRGRRLGRGAQGDPADRDRRLLAGAFSMAAGEYVSMASQRETYQREIALEAAELEEKPDEERDEQGY